MPPDVTFGISSMKRSIWFVTQFDLVANGTVTLGSRYCATRVEIPYTAS